MCRFYIKLKEQDCDSERPLPLRANRSDRYMHLALALIALNTKSGSVRFSLRQYSTVNLIKILCDDSGVKLFSQIYYFWLDLVNLLCARSYKRGHNYLPLLMWIFFSEHNKKLKSINCLILRKRV